MSAVKDLWFDLMQEKMADLIEKGYSEEAAYEIASDRAYHELGDRMADLADRIKERKKYDSGI